MKKINVYVDSSVRWAAYKKDDEYQAWIDYAIANNLWGQPGSYTVEVVDAAAEIEQKRLQAEGARKQDFDAHVNSTSNPHSVTKEQVGLSNVDNVAAADLRNRSTHTGSQPASTISDFDEAAQDAVGNALLNSDDINFQYPDVNNQITAALTTTGVTPGSYSLVSVDNKGRVTAGSNTNSITRYSAVNNATAVNSNATYTTVVALTTPILPTGLYSFKFFGLMQSGATANGSGIRIATGTATLTTVNAKWFVTQSANVSASNTTQNINYTWDQLNTTTNVVSGSIAAANTTFNVMGEGMFRVTATGTVVIQIRSEVNGTASSLLADSYLEVALV